ncbi:K(+)-transporting ATPase subunit C [Taibaiella lutea]|uniref:Potassium-transporting ATPase KdpC subunit n=1 Tax=Taibaiella lutea TaxID=2608001 RepID=A0A5M6CFQ8_9BACT|nr:K(+)-transporting ATPase subunit C [Taibaiella lutea]KAA5533793.1 K(+)-transporting ATPase subunit C [Taibaiella lutea]
MKKNLLPAIRLTLVCLVFFCGIYTTAVWGIAQLVPNKGKGFTINQNDKSYYTNVGQSFKSDRYFWSRPSAVDYNAAGSGGSNKGPSNADYLAQVQQRIDTFLARNPGISKQDIPSDIVTASGSGLDPNISVDAALVQMKRIAAVRSIDAATLKTLIEQQTEKPMLGLFGTSKINVLNLNLALDKISHK